MRRFAAAAALTLACLAAVIFACQWTDRCLGEWEDLLERTRQAAQRGDLEEARLLTEVLNHSLEEHEAGLTFLFRKDFLANLKSKFREMESYLAAESDQDLLNSVAQAEIQLELLQDLFFVIF